MATPKKFFSRFAPKIQRTPMTSRIKRQCNRLSLGEIYSRLQADDRCVIRGVQFQPTLVELKLFCFKLKLHFYTKFCVLRFSLVCEPNDNPFSSGKNMNAIKNTFFRPKNESEIYFSIVSLDFLTFLVPLVVPV